MSENSVGMDSPDSKNISGTELVETLLNSTGLPENLVGEELGGILENAGASPATLTLEELRSAMLAYLESTLAEAIEQDVTDGDTAERQA